MYSFTNVATAKSIEQHPTWPHDTWSDPKNNSYISFYYANNSSAAGYTSIYFDDAGKQLPKLCYIKFKLVEAYPGLNVTNSTAPVNNTTPEKQGILNNTTEPIKKASEISLYLKNETSGDSAQIQANLQSQPSRGTLDKIKESLGNMIDAIFGGY